MTATVIRPSAVGHRRREGGVPPAPPSRRTILRNQRRTGWWLSFPATSHLVIFLAIPAVVSFVLSFFDYGFLSAPEFIGLDNYVALAGDARFGTALVNTLIFTATVVPVSMAISIAVAVALNQRLKARAWYRTAFYLPEVTATLAIAIVWTSLYNPDTGLFNIVLSFFGFGRIAWLQDPQTALLAIIIMSIWQALGFKIILYLAGLQNLPGEVLEAAEIDGASPWQRFFHVTLPMLGPTHVFVLITSVIASFQVFDQVYAMTEGGPIYSSTVITYEIYLNAFQRFKFGYACAEAVVLFLLIIGVLLAGVGIKRLLEARRGH
ncbi:sugar ABC transporter permease [Microbacterium invictum]|uniref:Sugar ABC transporter permease n=1 Tax=Microbacterium invictum TaxID=515415 RepID=A0ABZ0VB37_9MICO|nr:sugar ABC transporter permease [Microbacterium invictum]WQB70694.1 sugar ABC transporter permease [Microbacterium invictum]